MIDATVLSGSRCPVQSPAGAYDTLAGVYDWLVPEPLRTPGGAVAAFAEVVDALAPRARVLDCAAGTGQLAVGLALRGHRVVASDASPAMIRRTAALAAAHGADVPAVACAWDALPGQGWQGAFDAVFCVGNSLPHAGPGPARRAALAAMAGVLRGGGLLVVTSRNWELVRAQGSGVRVGDRLVEHDGERALVVYGWTLPDGTDQPLHIDVTVARIADDGAVIAQGERLVAWPFTHTELDDDLRAAGLTPRTSTYDADADGYLVTAQRAS